MESATMPLENITITKNVGHFISWRLKINSSLSMLFFVTRALYSGLLWKLDERMNIQIHVWWGGNGRNEGEWGEGQKKAK